MSDVVTKAVAALNEKMGGEGLDGTAKFVIEDEGTIIVDEAGAREADGDADVTLTASAETFDAIVSGDENPTAAFMSGKLAVDGDMGMAMKLSSLLA
ncbi:SCP2 sterol-binding domain-containing protein [Pseudoroseicyclus tamaricis]|uniref:SCP2 sterol-binding domain-containing protein n=1 Tax=Pseudoroseicyclus tamaricis TaxID=2705421 RepID=A0A6B2JVK2_9RHOB|nr:SCP2 sterol-binding domain-containing protein [Pseudoroseicyclus tamaricis]NDV01925.1 SCP2 sterol-binding domain-containing protein [Pseudoroseicyclus tamaricis]